jgi:Calcium-dependent channel, 7TM region, putative phosphate/Late exocytosis, associated with Golgi transport/Cytosolic domain of 10TM putative phosphate transporter
MKFRAQFMVYGSVLIVVFAIFCYVRLQFPRPYTLRNWVHEIQTDLAQHQFGAISWMWEMNSFTERDLMLECGMDAVSVLRVLRMGYKIACVGIFNAIFLMPVYATSHPDVIVTDRITKLTIGNVAEGSPRLVATVVAAYLLFGYTMYMIYKEFVWFTAMRHEYLSQPVPQNYAVYVRNIPSEYRSNAALKQYFAHCLSEPDVVTEVRLKIKDNALQRAYAQRETILKKLMHALNVRDVLGKTPRHRPKQLLLPVAVVGDKVDSIPTYARELKAANQLVASLQQAIQVRTTEADNSTSMHGMLDMEQPPPSSPQNTSLLKGSYNGHDALRDETSSEMLEGSATTEEPSDSLAFSSTNEATASNGNYSGNNKNKTSNTSGPLTLQDTAHSSAPTSASGNNNLLGQGVHLLKHTTAAAAQNAVSKTQSVVGAATDLIPNLQDGDYYPSGFVCFRTLRATHAALQMVHHEHPFYVKVSEAPRPQDIFWANVGRKHQDLVLGRLFSIGATTALCLLWTIPIAFVASLSSVKGLSDKVPFVRRMIEVAPFIGSVLEVLAPLFVKVVNSLLPTILGIFSMLEGPVSESAVEASTFSKLAAFMIIQTFFVSAVSSSILDEIAVVIDQPNKLVQILAVSLPTKSVYFIQIVFVGTVVSCSLEMLRIKPLIFALLRRVVPPNLTEKERQTTAFGILRPLADPTEFEHGDYVSQIVRCILVAKGFAFFLDLGTRRVFLCLKFSLATYDLCRFSCSLSCWCTLSLHL